jgi:L,D-peptidoglycan transpeptidase YkuD (ErfK/YbiS/YcfS/YnhG family)
MSRIISQLHVRVRKASDVSGRLQVGHVDVPCLIGRGGVTAMKREGDGATPRGTMRLLGLLRRGDRERRFASSLSQRAVAVVDGWCDAVADRNYNRPVKLPYGAGHEALWRVDAAYDAVVVLDWNISPRVKGRGSAIFFHLIRDGAEFTEGCVAVSAKDMRKILAVCGKGTRLVVW